MSKPQLKLAHNFQQPELLETTYPNPDQNHEAPSKISTVTEFQDTI